MVRPISQFCKFCRRIFLGSDCISYECMDCSINNRIKEELFGKRLSDWACMGFTYEGKSDHHDWIVMTPEQSEKIRKPDHVVICRRCHRTFKKAF